MKKRFPWAGASLAAAAASALPLCFLPPAARDELAHHLALPALWIESGSLKPVPGVLVSYFPAWTEILYAGALALHAEWPARLIHFLLGMLVLAMPALIRSPGNLTPALPLALLWLLTPAFYYLLGVAYSDLGALAAILAGFLLWARWLEGDGGRKTLAAASFCMGLALAVKYTALPALGVFGLATIVEIGRRRLSEGSRRAYLDLLALLPALLAPAPHLWSNYGATGNPIYPLLHAFWTGHSAGSGIPLPESFLREKLYGENFLLRALVPLRVYLTGVEGSPERFDGVLNPLWLCWPLLFLWTSKSRRDRTDWSLAAAWAAVTLLTFLSASARARYYLPALAPLAVLFLRRRPLVEWTAKRKKIAAALGGAALLFGLAHNALTLAKSGVFPYFLGGQSREAFLQERVPEYGATRLIAQKTPPDAVVYPILTGNRFYYIEREVRLDQGFLPERIEGAVRDAADPEDVARRLAREGITHLLYPPYTLESSLRADLAPEAYQRAREFFTKVCLPVGLAPPFAVCEVPGL